MASAPGRNRTSRSPPEAEGEARRSTCHKSLASGSPGFIERSDPEQVRSDLHDDNRPETPRPMERNDAPEARILDRQPEIPVRRMAIPLEPKRLSLRGPRQRLIARTRLPGTISIGR